MVMSIVPVGVMILWVWMDTSPEWRSPNPVGLVMLMVVFGGMFPERLRVTEPVNPLRGSMVTKYGAPLPRFTCRKGGFVPGLPTTIIWKSGAAAALTPPAGAAAAGAGVRTSIVPKASIRAGSKNSRRSRMNLTPLCPHLRFRDELAVWTIG